MFEFFFKYPLPVFRKGSLVFLASWPLWSLALAIAAAAGALAWLNWRRRAAAGSPVRAGQALTIWLLQSSLAVLLLLLLWQPALSLSTLAPQQNIVAVVLDGSRSMDLADDGSPRRERMLSLLRGGLLASLERRFQVRLFQLDGGLTRLASLDDLKPGAPATRIGAGLQRLLDESATLPLGAVILLSDGADNTGGIGLPAITALRQHRVPIHTIGFGSTAIVHDVELSGLDLPPRMLAGSRVEAVAAIRQSGFSGQSARLTVRKDGAVLAQSNVVLGPEGKTQTERILFNAGPAGVSNIDVSLAPLPGESNSANNRLTRAVFIDGSPRRILYVEGEPRWEFKFLRRAVEDDKSLQIVSMLRTTQNKIYRQGVSNPKELEDGFPSKVEDLFDYQAIILGSVEAGYFTTTQRDLIREFVDRRGGGLLFLGGRFALADGGYQAEPFPELLPVELPRRTGTFVREPAYAALTPAGRESLICRIEDDPRANVERWKKLPYLANYQDAGTPKPGALLLASMTAGGAKLPLLVTENYGRGRTAVFATAGSWRWQMLQPLADMSHETFWRQLLRWLSGLTPSHVAASTPEPIVQDAATVELRADVRDATYLPAADAQVEARLSQGGSTLPPVPLRPDPRQPGVYTGSASVPQPGSYAAEIVATRSNTELGRSVATFRREDGTAENFHQEQNRDLLDQLASQTGGRYFRPNDTGQLPSEISLSSAGISQHETRDLWNMPAFLLLALLLRSTEWLLRRRWGFV